MIILCLNLLLLAAPIVLVSAVLVKTWKAYRQERRQNRKSLEAHERLVEQIRKDNRI